MHSRNYFSLLVLFLSITVTAQINNMSNLNDDGTNRNTKFNKLTSSIYYLQSDGGNIGVYFGKDEIFMIDSQTSSEIDNNLKIIKRVSKNPIKYLVSTGSHPDHNGGNKKIDKEGAIILSHEATKNKINKLGKNRSDNKAITRGLLSADITFSKDLTIYFNNEKVEIIPANNRNSNGDVMVYFSKSNVLFTGDVFYIKNKYPVIDFDNGNSANNMINGLSKISKIANASTKIVPGHGEVANMSEVNASINMLTTLFKKIQNKRASGKTLDDVLRSKSEITGRFDNKGYGDGDVKSNDIITSLYHELEKTMGPLDTRTPQEKANARLKEMQKEKEAKGRN